MSTVNKLVALTRSTSRFPSLHEEMYRMEAERAHEMMRRFLAGDRTPTIPEKL